MSIARFWRGQKQRYQLSGAVCPYCGTMSVTARPICPECAQRRAEARQSKQALTWAFALLYTMAEPLRIARRSD